MSNKLKPTDWQTQAAIFTELGFVLERQKGSHLCYVKDGVRRPVIIPKYPEVGLDIIKRNMKTAGVTRREYLAILKRLK